MALKQIILAKKINERASQLEKLMEQRSELEAKAEVIERAIEEAETDEEVQAVEEEVTNYEEENKKLKEDIKKLEAEKAELEAELKEIEDQAQPKKEENEERGKMKKIEVNEEKLELRKALTNFVRSKGVEKRGLTSVEGGALIPEELLAAQLQPEDVTDLRKYVRTVQVSSSDGKYPVISKANSKMVTVAELEENPKLANPTIKKIDFSVETRRGYIPISMELIDDADYDVTGLIASEIKDQERNTVNADIATAFKTMTAKAVEGIDGLKDLVNKELKQVYNIKFYVSASLFAELDKLKDKNGRYLLQDNITVASGKVLFGKEVIVLDDDVIGTQAGDLVGFVGDAKEAISYFDRKKASLEWVDNNIYGKLLAGVVRYDVQPTDTEAGFYITYTNTVEEVTP